MPTWISLFEHFLEYQINSEICLLPIRGPVNCCRCGSWYVKTVTNQKDNGNGVIVFIGAEVCLRQISLSRMFFPHVDFRHKYANKLHLCLDANEQSYLRIIISVKLLCSLTFALSEWLLSELYLAFNNNLASKNNPRFWIIRIFYGMSQLSQGITWRDYLNIFLRILCMELFKCYNCDGNYRFSLKKDIRCHKMYNMDRYVTHTEKYIYIYLLFEIFILTISWYFVIMYIYKWNVYILFICSSAKKRYLIIITVFR